MLPRYGEGLDAIGARRRTPGSHTEPPCLRARSVKASRTIARPHPLCNAARRPADLRARMLGTGSVPLEFPYWSTGTGANAENGNAVERSGLFGKGEQVRATGSIGQR